MNFSVSSEARCYLNTNVFAKKVDTRTRLWPLLSGQGGAMALTIEALGQR
jgi:hypothetical protein